MTPKLIQLVSSDITYANTDLIKFVKQTISVQSDVIKPGDSIYFFKDVDFKRGLLDVAKDAYQRVIKMDKATVIVVNSDMTFPQNWLALKNNRIDSNCPQEEADDIVYNISSINATYVSTMQQWMEFFSLTNKPRVVFANNLLSHINSGMIIDESNLDMVLDLFKSDVQMAANIVDTCDIEKSYMFVLSLFFFYNGRFNSPNWDLMNKCPNVIKYLSSRGIHNSISDKQVLEFLQVPYFRNRYIHHVSEIINKDIQSRLGVFSKYVEGIDVNFRWKQ